MGGINLLWKQIDAPVGFGCKLYIRKYSEKDFTVSIVFEMIDFQWDLNDAIFMVPLTITLTHENVRGRGTKYISWAIKMLWKGQKSTLRIFMAY